MQIKKELISRKIAGEMVLVPVGTSVYSANGLFVLNELAAFIWELLPEAQGPEQILAAVLAEYDVDPETARKDVAEFLDQLAQMEIL